jgi:acetylornithine deacetylase/succinyl-diaminopimelate desuccinylase-like protein
MAPLAGAVSELAQTPRARACLDWFRRERAWINDEHLALCRIPAPTFFEQKRAEWLALRFRALGWESKIDRAGNVLASLSGRREAPSVAVTAHLDTVLAPRASADIRLNGDGKITGPGVADNGAGLAALVALAAAWTAAPPLEDPPLAPLLVATVGEEGEGNLSGMRYLCRHTASRGSLASRLRAFLVLDGPGTERVTSRALASRRFEVSFSGPGGHSWTDYGSPNPVHALSRAVTCFADGLPSQDPPRFSYNFGVIQGGSSVNAIPAEARAKVDLRSESAARLDELASLLAAAVERAAELENARAASGRVSARAKEIGVRPAGELPPGSPILECVQAVDAHLRIRSVLDTSSTDANIPLSLGLAAVSIGAGGVGGGAHTPSEWFQPDGRDLGLRRILLILCLLLGAPAR